MQKSVMTNSMILTRNEVMEMLDISPATLWRWCKAGKIKSLHIGSRIYFKHDDIMNSLIEKGGNCEK